MSPLFCLLLGLAGPALATQGGHGDFAAEAVGTTGSEFLLYDIGARGIGMGGAYTAVTADSNSLYWNPAGLTRVPRVSAGFMYTHYIIDTNYQSANYAQRITDTVVIAGGWRYMDYGNIDHTGLANEFRGGFHPRSYVAEAGWAQTLLDQSDSDMDLSVGSTLRWIHTDILRQADGLGGDLGMQARFFTNTFHYDLAFAAQNMGMGQNFDQTRDTLPFRARLGGAIYPIKPLVVSVEGIFPISNVPHGALGLEYTFEMHRRIKAMLRAGFNSLTLQTLGPWSTMSMGMGLTVMDFTIDYAFQSYGVLGTADVHRVSLTFNLPSKASQRYRERN